MTSQLWEERIDYTFNNDEITGSQFEEKNELIHYHTIYVNMNVLNLNVRGNVIKYLKENLRNLFCEIELGNYFLNKTLKPNLQGSF